MKVSNLTLPYSHYQTVNQVGLHNVRFSQLLATDTMDYASHFAGQVAFSAGYAIDEDDQYSKYWQKYYSMAENHPVLKLWMVPRSVKLNPIFLNPVALLTLTFWLNPTTEPPPPPHFQSIFHPFERMLVFGKLDMAPPQKNQSIWKHHIPGWFGMSRSLVGMFIGNTEQGGDLDAHIIGICKWMSAFSIWTLVAYNMY